MTSYCVCDIVASGCWYFVLDCCECCPPLFLFVDRFISIVDSSPKQPVFAQRRIKRMSSHNEPMEEFTQEHCGLVEYLHKS